jgi:hypothetical protein
LESIYESIAQLNADHGPSVLEALTVYSSIVDNPVLPSALSPADRTRLYDIGKLAYDRWNQRLCKRAEANGFTCVDTYHAFNGPDGLAPAGQNLGQDYAHPSQAGNDVIAALLADVPLQPITG